MREDKFKELIGLTGLHSKPWRKLRNTRALKMGVLICTSSLISAALNTEWFSRYFCHVPVVFLHPLHALLITIFKNLISLGVSICPGQMPWFDWVTPSQKSEIVFSINTFIFCDYSWVFDSLILYITQYLILIIENVSLLLASNTNTMNLKRTSLPSKISWHAYVCFHLFCFQITYANSI